MRLSLAPLCFFLVALTQTALSQGPFKQEFEPDVPAPEEFKKNRNEKLVEDKLNALKNKLNSTKNIMSSIIECVEANATLGEISNILKEKFGEYQG